MLPKNAFQDSPNYVSVSAIINIWEKCLILSTLLGRLSENPKFYTIDHILIAKAHFKEKIFQDIVLHCLSFNDF